MANRGKLFVIAAPSGAGKTSLVRALMERRPALRFSISYTTRKQRPTERDGHDYFFVDKPEFERMVAAGEFLEHARVFDNYYGTSRKQVEQILDQGQDVLLEIDWQGAQQVRRLIPEAVHIFILPPSLQLLRERLEKRGQDSDEVIRRRLEAAQEEMRHCADFDYVIMNQDFARAVDDLSAIVRAARLTSPRQLVRHAHLLQRLLEN